MRTPRMLTRRPTARLLGAALGLLLDGAALAQSGPTVNPPIDSPVILGITWGTNTNLPVFSGICAERKSSRETRNFARISRFRESFSFGVRNPL